MYDEQRRAALKALGVFGVDSMSIFQVRYWFNYYSQRGLIREAS